MSPLRICHVIHNTELGGTENMLFQVLRQLAGQPLELSVISLIRCGEIGQRIRKLGIPVFAMKFARHAVPRPDRLLRLVAQVRRLRPDVVQTWAYHADLCGGIAARIATKAAVVWNVRHATLDPKLDSNNVLRSARLCGRISNWVPDKILLNAEAAIGVHVQAGYDQSKMQVLSNGFDTNRFRPLPDERAAFRREINVPIKVPLIGMCGRFHRHKGQAEFIKVAKQISAKYSRAHFLIAGNRCDESNIELATWIGDADLSQTFRLLGPRNDMPRVLNAMDVHLLPSLTEGMPNIVGEAMACGVSTVATDVGDAKRLIGDCGIVVESDNVAAMSQAVCQLLTRSADERADLGRRARQRITESFEIGAVAAKYVSAWRDVMDSRKRMAISQPLKTAVVPISNGSASRKNSTSFRPKLVHVTTIPMTQWLFLRGQNDFMTESGFDVHAVSSPGPNLPKLRDRDPVTTHEVPISRRIQPVRDIVTAFRLWRLFRDLRPEIVQLSTPKAALLGAIAAQAAGIPIRIYQVRGLSSESESGMTRRVFQGLERFTARLCNGCLVNARSLLDYGRQARILQSGYVAGMGMSNGVDLNRFDPANVKAVDLSAWDQTGNQPQGNGPVIGYIGRLTRDKGLEELFQAWRILREEFSNAQLLLVGPWEAENAASKACREGLRADRRVLMVGAHDDVVPFYKSMDVFAFPSHGTEGFPNAPMEAAAMGLPVIATRVIGCVDAVVDGVTGTLVSPRSAEQLERALRAYLASPELRVRHGTAGRDRIRSGFAPEDLWAEFRDYYIHLLRREGLPVPSSDESTVPLPKAA